MKFFSLISQNTDVSPNSKIMSSEEFSTVIDASELLDRAINDSKKYKKQVEAECVVLREEAKKSGFAEGMKLWSEQLMCLEKETNNVQAKLKEALIPLAIASIKKIIGKELEMKPDIVVSLITNALKTVNQNKKITIFINPEDSEIVEGNKSEFRKVIEYADSIIISPRNDIEKGGCIIETESGIVNAQIKDQLAALEKAFTEILKESKETVSEEDKKDNTNNSTNSNQEK
ncbi:MAG: HrpE/YscL family type III secretion apparatus protein [Victivallaceae bacterium]